MKLYIFKKLLSIILLSIIFLINISKTEESSSSEYILDFIYVEQYGGKGCNSKTGETVVDDNYCAFINDYPTIINTTANGESFYFSVFNSDDYLCSNGHIERQHVKINTCFASCPKGCTDFNVYIKYQPALSIKINN
ncbi:hypothetical protein DDB_G0277261 [Dictyostelium discoideum AX4]|uniref:Secreted protein n=1 Tax=Dictyostelium discoideum TaxID=44689 RepID=Q86K37_DICDI|nr:hypothetical protein DDB_G0277261 [Dictyostelium discoideum AX4]EAL68816.1 hypothetical protein DDB_G0277261 [Dictyostelium discoideum AX4]|eukprot:XP_642767.1 hypothetical protein DDB_G0277261 [Dictyostelium discoideum AX4]